MNGSVSSPDLCLYFHVIQSLKAHQTPDRAEDHQVLSQPEVSSPSQGRPAWRPGWAGWLAAAMGR